MKKRWIIPATICICFILIQSAIPESKSAKESLWFTEQFLNPLLSRFGIVANKDIIRKIAHAVEFFALSLMMILWWQKPVRSYYAGFTLAFLDESLQVLSKRGALITDIWIDLIGVGTGTLIGWIIVSKNKTGENSSVQKCN